MALDLPYLNKKSEDNEQEQPDEFSGKLQDYGKYLDLLKPKAEVPSSQEPSADDSDMEAYYDENNAPTSKPLISKSIPSNEDSDMEDYYKDDLTRDPDKQQPNIADAKEPISPDFSEQLQSESPSKNSSLSTVENLLKAQGLQNENVFQNQLLKSLDRLGAGIARTQPVAQEDYDSRIKMSGLPVQQFEQMTQMEKLDPKSSTASGLRTFLKDQFKVNLPENISVADIEKIAPWAIKAYETKQQKQLTLSLSKEKLDEEKRHHKELEALTGERIDSGDDKAEKKKIAQQNKENTTRFDKMNSLIVAEKASSRSTFGIDSKTVQGADTLKALLSSEKNFDDLDQRQAYEAARVLDRMLSQGTPTEASSGKLTPDTAKKWLMGKWEYITNTRKGAQLGDFLKTTAATADRERQVALDRIRKTQGKLLGSFYDLREKDPVKWGIVMRQNDLPEDLLDQPKNPLQPLMAPYQQMQNGATQSVPQMNSNPTAPSSKPKQVIQNGHTYTLNEQTGQYE